MGESTKKNMIEMVQYPIEYPEIYAKYGQSPSRGCLLWGPPGCGKTMLAKAIASECAANFISIKGPELLTMWFGESEANVRDVFDKARNASPCIVFFDELDAIARSRGGSHGDAGGAGDRVMNQLLTEMDGINPAKQVFFIGATNRPDIIDPAIRRPGRLDSMIFIDLPDFPARVSILKATLRKSPVDPAVDFEYIAEKTHGFSGADLANISKCAAQIAIREMVAAEVKKVREKEAARARAEQLGQELPESDDEDDAGMPENAMISQHMLELAMRETQRSVTQEQYQKYIDMKERFERDAGPGAGGMAGITGPVSSAPAASSGSVPAAGPAAADQPSLLDDDSDTDDIY